MDPIMKRTLRLLAAPAAAMLLLASCGSSEPADEAAPSSTTLADEVSDAGGEASDADGEEKSSGEIQAEHAEENPDGAPMDDGGDDSEYEPEWGPTGEAMTGTYDGALITATLRGESPDDIEELREATGQDPVGYIRVEIDNTNGIDDADVLSISLVDDSGNQYEYEQASDVYTEWGGTMRDDGEEPDPYWYSDADGNEISEEIYDEHQNMIQTLDETYWDTSSMPTAQSTAWLIGPEVPETITYSELTQPGMDIWPMVPTGN